VRRHCQMLVSISGAVRLIKGREMVENEPHERQPRASMTGENSDRVDALIREKRQITVRKLSGILNITGGSVKIIIKQHLKKRKEKKRKDANISDISPG